MFCFWLFLFLLRQRKERKNSGQDDEQNYQQAANAKTGEYSEFTNGGDLVQQQGAKANGGCNYRQCGGKPHMGKAQH